MNPNVNTPMPLLATLETFIKVLNFFEETHSHRDAQKLALETFKRAIPKSPTIKTPDEYLALAKQVQAEADQKYSPEQREILQKLANYTGLPWPPPNGYSAAGAASEYIKKNHGAITCGDIDDAIAAHVQNKFDRA